MGKCSKKGIKAHSMGVLAVVQAGDPILSAGFPPPPINNSAGTGLCSQHLVSLKSQVQDKLFENQGPTRSGDPEAKIRCSGDPETSGK